MINIFKQLLTPSAQASASPLNDLEPQGAASESEEFSQLLSEAVDTQILGDISETEMSIANDEVMDISALLVEDVMPSSTMDEAEATLAATVAANEYNQNPNDIILDTQSASLLLSSVVNTIAKDGNDEPALNANDALKIEEEAAAGAEAAADTELSPQLAAMLQSIPTDLPDASQVTRAGEVNILNEINDIVVLNKQPSLLHNDSSAVLISPTQSSLFGDTEGAVISSAMLANPSLRESIDTSVNQGQLPVDTSLVDSPVMSRAQRSFNLQIPTTTPELPQQVSPAVVDGELSQLAYDAESPEVVKFDSLSPELKKFLQQPAANDAEILTNTVTNTAPTQQPASTGLNAPMSKPEYFIQTAVQDAKWREAFTEKVQWLSSQNIKAATLQLHPRDLGPVDIAIKYHANHTASVTFSAPHVLARDAVEMSLPRLREMMAEQGIELTDAHVSEQNHYQDQRSDNEDPRHGSIAGSVESDDETVTIMRQDRNSSHNGTVDDYA